MLAAIFSDIHGIEPALDALEDDLSDLRIDGVPRKLDVLWCLGDLAGYGPFPISSMTRIQEWLEKPQPWLQPSAQNLCLCGNHDDGLLRLIKGERINSQLRLDVGDFPSGDNFNDEALKILHRQANLIRDDAYTATRQWLGERPLRARPFPGYYLAHGFYTDDDIASLWDYASRDESTRLGQMQSLIATGEAVRFVALGHLHIAGLWQYDGKTFQEKDVFGETWHEFHNISQQPVLLNCGSISLPHVGKDVPYPCSVYVLLDIVDEDTIRVQFRRLNFSVEHLVGPDKPINPAYPGYTRLKERLEAVQRCASEGT